MNVIVEEASVHAGAGGFGYLEFALIGVPLVIATVVVCALLGRRLLPDRTPVDAPADFADYVPALAEHWAADYRMWRLTVPPNAPPSGSTQPPSQPTRGWRWWPPRPQPAGSPAPGTD